MPNSSRRLSELRTICAPISSQTDDPHVYPTFFFLVYYYNFFCSNPHDTDPLPDKNGGADCFFVISKLGMLQSLLLSF
jgi:hypothetical protein